MTTITITDPALIEQLLRDGEGEFRDPSGRVLMRFIASGKAPVEPSLRRPAYTRDDVRRFREQLEAARRQAETEPIDETRDFKPPPGFKLPPLPDRGPAHLERGKPLLEALRDLEERL